MSKDLTQLNVFGTGSIFVGVSGVATLPTDINDVLGAGWSEIGYTDDKGVQFEDAKTIQDIHVWQQYYPGRKIVSARSSFVKFAMAQWSRSSFSLAFGGTWSTTTNGWKFSPPAPGTLDVRSVVVDLVDGSLHRRFVLPKAIVSDKVDANFTRTDAAWLPVQLDVIGTDGLDPWYALTDNNILAA